MEGLGRSLTDETQRSLGRVEGKLDLLIDRTHGFDERLNSVEKKVWWLSGIAALGSVLFGKFTGGH